MQSCQWLVNGSEKCGKVCEGKNSLCASHARLARKIATDAEREAEKRDITLKKAVIKNSQPRPTPNKVSPKRQELNKEYFKLVEQFKKDNPECKAKVNEYCTEKTEDPHHSRGRGKYLLDVSTWIPVCRSCHIWIGNNHQEAEAKGLVFSRLAETEPHKI